MNVVPPVDIVTIEVDNGHMLTYEQYYVTHDSQMQHMYDEVY